MSGPIIGQLGSSLYFRLISNLVATGVFLLVFLNSGSTGRVDGQYANEMGRFPREDIFSHALANLSRSTGAENPFLLIEVWS